MTDGNQTLETSEQELILARVFDAPREFVFAAYSSCEHLSNWFGPRTWPMAECTMDFRVGGVWHYCLRGPNEGDESWGISVFQEIIEPERLVYTDAFSNADGNVNESMPQTQVHLDFEDAHGKTRITMKAHYESPTALKQVLDMGMAAGITETLDRLEDYLTQTVKLSS